MFAKNIFSSEDSFKGNYFKNSQNFIPNVEHKLRMFFKKKCNKYLNINIPRDLENEEIKQVNDEDIFPANNNSIINSIIEPFSCNFNDEINNDINISSIELEESNEDDQNIPINVLNKRVSDITIPIKSSSSGLNTKIERTKIFSTVYPKKVTIFTKPEREFEFIKIKNEEEFLNKKRRRNKEDDIRRMIGRRFFNDVLLNLINAILKKAGCINVFEKFQQDVVYYLVKKFNKPVLNMTLEDIFKKKELYNDNNL